MNFDVQEECMWRNNKLIAPIRRMSKVRTDPEANVGDVTVDDSQTKGYETEYRFFRIVNHFVSTKRYRWLINIRKVSDEEDRFGGYDFVLTFLRDTRSHCHTAETYEVAIDTKSSRMGELNYRKRRGNNGVFTITAGINTASEKSIKCRLRSIWMKTRDKPPQFTRFGDRNT